MRLQIPALIFSAAAWAGLTTPAARAQVPEGSPYKELTAAPAMEALFSVAFTRDRVNVSVWIDGVAYTVAAEQEEIRVEPNRVEVEKDRLWFDVEGLHFRDSALAEERILRYDEIADSRVTDNSQSVDIAFLTVRGDMDRLGRLRRGNEITFNDPITVESRRFIRGLVLSIAGRIEVYGEVNKDVISLFGDVYVAPGATARGDLATVTGGIELGDDAAVYGELYSGSEYLERRRPRFYREENFALSADFVYNRVDGATPYAGVKFRDVDSLLPSVWVRGGYAFESSRWRVELGLEQTLWRKYPLAVGGAYYRRLASEDDWLLTDFENTVLTLVAGEDYKDYWEAEGGVLWVDARPRPDLQVVARYRYEESNWRRAYRGLWSVLGLHDQFRKNFHYVPDDFRASGIAEIDTSANGALSLQVDYDTRHNEEPFDFPGWRVAADFEWSSPDFSSDFDYRRYTLDVRRYQPLHRSASLQLRTVFGNSDGRLPMHKRFYLGGLGTLEGYKIKEMMGTRFWFANAEYRFQFPKSDVSASVFWQLGQIANDEKLDSDVDLKQSVGAALMLGTDFRISLAKRLDRSENADPRFLVRLNYEF